MPIPTFIYDGKPITTSDDIEKLLGEKDRQISDLKMRIAELEFDLQECEDPL